MKFAKKNILIGLAIILLTVTTSYCVYGYQLGKTVKEIVISAYRTHYTVENNPYAEMISDDLYNQLIQRKSGYFTTSNMSDKFHVTSPLVLWWPNRANIYIKYSHLVYQDNELVSGCMDVPIHFTLERYNNQWKIVNIYEAP